MRTSSPRASKSFEVAVRGVPVERLPGTVLSRDGGRCLVDVSDVMELSRLLSAVQEHHGEVVSIFPRRDTLEDLFIQEVQGGEGSS